METRDKYCTTWKGYIRIEARICKRYVCIAVLIDFNFVLAIYVPFCTLQKIISEQFERSSYDRFR